MTIQSNDFPRPAKPRIALMGEFSAGKSTLANLLLEQEHSPVQVTATQLPPVWYSFGDSPPQQVTLEGARQPVQKPHWRDVCLGEAQLIEVQLEADVLEAADLIDVPGTCDPNLPAQYWETLITQVDLVIWCTPAHQAWRQSEAALWETVPEELRERSLLLITRIDKILSEDDRRRILQRATNEAGHLFAQVSAASLTEALAAPHDETALERSGVADMVRFLIRMLERVGDTSRGPFVPHVEAGAAPPPLADATPVATPPTAAPPGLIVPRRIVRKNRQLAARPTA
ncbi:MAG: dynamin family protein [Pseudomonadota bacterium]